MTLHNQMPGILHLFTTETAVGISARIFQVEMVVIKTVARNELSNFIELLFWKFWKELGSFKIYSWPESFRLSTRIQPTPLFVPQEKDVTLHVNFIA